MPIRRLLETTELFATLPPVALATLSERAELRHYAAQPSDLPSR